jgi:hypothetical protein
MSWTRRDVLALGSGALAAASMTPALTAAQTPKRGGTLTIRGWDPPLFDPMLTTAYRVQVPISFTHRHLRHALPGRAEEPEPRERPRGDRPARPPAAYRRSHPTREVLAELQRHLARQQYDVQLASPVAIVGWDGVVKNYGPNLGYDYGGRLVAAWLDR